MLTTTRLVSCPNPKLSIHVAHLPERVEKLSALLAVLKPQAEAWGNIEILMNSAPRGSITTGAKRNLMMAASRGVYSCAIDDDDMVSINYCELLLQAFESNTDCVGMVGVLNNPGQPTWTFRHSITVKNWSKDKARRIYFRPPNHLNPIKTEICRRCPFPDITIGEDRAFSDAVKMLTRSEVFIEDPIYFYTPGGK